MSVVYEIRVEREDGWLMGTGERWYGVRFKYRLLGSRGRWSKFLATSDAPHDFDNLPIETMQAMCRRHAEGFPGVSNQDRSPASEPLDGAELLREIRDDGHNQDTSPRA